jgi:uncharacterized DUF497 family protein
MDESQFEWDYEKARRNINQHGVSFDAATNVFADPFAINWFDDRFDYGEDRYAIIGMVGGRLIVVDRGEVIRIISARGAEPHERRRYYEENARGPFRD